MNCEDVQERLTDALLGEAPPSVREDLLEHAARCAACTSAAEETRRTLDLLRASSWPGEAVLGQAERRRLYERATASRRPVRWLAVAASLAAAAVVAGVSVPALRRARVEPPSPVLPEAAPPARATDPAPATRPPAPSVRQAPPAAVPVPAASAAPPPPAPPGTLAALHLGTVADAASLSPKGSSGAGPLVGTRPRQRLAPALAETQREAAVFGLQAPGAVKVAGVMGDFATRAPERQPSAMFFEHRGTNPWVATERDHLSTFGLDVDTASYTLARNYIRRGQLPPPEAVRVEEFVNALSSDEPDPGRETFGIGVETAASPFDGGRTFLRVGIRAKDVARRDRKPARLVFLVDVSGSMRMESRLELVKRGLQLLVERLDERDSIGIVAYGSSARVVLGSTPGSERDVILEAVERLQPEGSTNLEAGLHLAYAMASGAFDSRGVNRVVLCTDGVANNGVTDPQALVAQVKRRAEAGIDLTALGFGMGNYNDALLQRLADEGDGQYAYIDDLPEARRFFLRDLTGVLQTVARDARAQVEFDPRRVESYRLLGYEKRDLADHDFRDDAVDAGEVNAGQTVTALYELRLSFGEGPIGVVRVRFQDPETRAPGEVHREIGDAAADGPFEEASAQLQLTVLAARFAEHLRQSRFLPPGERLDGLVRLARRLPEATLRREDARELVGLVREASRLPPQPGRD
jgi:Ca-activated chloride channel family protein